MTCFVLSFHWSYRLRLYYFCVLIVLFKAFGMFHVVFLLFGFNTSNWNKKKKQFIKFTRRTNRTITNYRNFKLWYISQCCSDLSGLEKQSTQFTCRRAAKPLVVHWHFNTIMHSSVQMPRCVLQAAAAAAVLMAIIWLLAFGQTQDWFFCHVASQYPNTQRNSNLCTVILMTWFHLQPIIFFISWLSRFHHHHSSHSIALLSVPLFHSVINYLPTLWIYKLSMRRSCRATSPRGGGKGAGETGGRAFLRKSKQARRKCSTFQRSSPPSGSPVIFSLLRWKTAAPQHSALCVRAPPSGL